MAIGIRRRWSYVHLKLDPENLPREERTHTWRHHCTNKTQGTILNFSVSDPWTWYNRTSISHLRHTQCPAKAQSREPDQDSLPWRRYDAADWRKSISISVYIVYDIQLQCRVLIWHTDISNAWQYNEIWRDHWFRRFFKATNSSREAGVQTWDML